MEENMTFGWHPSVLDGTEFKFEAYKNMSIPEEYSYKKYLSPVLDQGKTNMCVTYSIAAHLNWNKNVDTESDNNKDNNINLNDIYSARSLKGDNGMTFKEALNFLRHTGCGSDLGNIKIEQYAMVNGIEALKQALILNGPCVGGFMVYNDGPEFWDKDKFKGNYGGHAIAIVGYNKEGFIIRNSWGKNWANNGYTVCPYSMFNYLLEAWTIID